MSDVNAPERIAELEAQVAKLTQERDAAIREVAKWAQEAGSAEARLSQPASGSGVKALEWKEDQDDDGTEIHRTRGGEVNLPYTIYEDGFTSKPFGLTLNQLRIGSFDTVPEAKAAAQADYERRIRSALIDPPSPQAVPSVREYCTCNSKTNPCIVCGKPKFIDPEWLKRKLEADPDDEGEIGAGFELFPLPAPQDASPAQSGEASPLGRSTTAYSRDQLAKLAYVTFYSPVLCAPQNIAAVVKEIDCCPGCDHVTNGGTCRVSERGDYCPNDLAETLRQISVALYGPGDPSDYVASVFGPDKVQALSAQDAPSASLAGAARSRLERRLRCVRPRRWHAHVPRRE